MSVMSSAFAALKANAYSILSAKRRMLFPSYGPREDNRLAKKQDYVRYSAIGLALKRLDAEQVPGALAEVGVFRGDTSEVLHRISPHRKLYLFDTFNGFPEEHLEDFQRGDKRFTGTRIESVRQRLGSSENIVFVPGVVPATFSALHDERFAFVMLDLDLLQPTRDSLDFFYPRLETGGYLFVHDYNNSESNWACRRALDEFLADKPERLVEIPDIWGSALIRILGDK